MPKALLQTSDCGGTAFATLVPVQEGEPQTLTQVKKFYRRISDARRFEWQYRTLMAFRELAHMHCYWITLTYAKEPALWEDARRNLNLWIKRVREYNRRVLCSPELGREFETIAYVAIEEEGSLRGRKHHHVLLWLPYFVDPGDKARRRSAFHLEKMLQWPHGFADVAKVRTGPKLAMYIAKYVHKSEGRVKCSSKFGLMTITTLLSSSAWQRLFLAAPNTAQKLLRRLSLTPNYPTSQRMTSLISSVRLSTTLQSISHPRTNRSLTGVQSSWLPPELRKNSGDAPVHLLRSAFRSLYIKALVQECVAVCSSLGFSAELYRRIAPRAVQPRALVSRVLPGIASFGKAYPVSRPPDEATRTWFTRFYHRHCASRRAALVGPTLPEARAAARSAAENRVFVSKESPVL